jgi:hypothetical protein
MWFFKGPQSQEKFSISKIMEREMYILENVLVTTTAQDNILIGICFALLSF